MKLKYYLRGLGIGIFVTAIVMGIALNNNKSLSDEDIIKRAEELGMVMKEDSLFTSEDSESAISAEEEEVSKDSTMAITEVNEEAATQQSTVNENTAVESAETVNTAEAAEAEEVTDTPVTDATNPQTDAAITEAVTDNTTTDTAATNASGSTPAVTEYQFTIASGMSSDKVARLLADNGMVDDAAAFNKFLVSNGYDKHIRVGQFTVNSNMDYKQISNIITGK